VIHRKRLNRKTAGSTLVILSIATLYIGMASPQTLSQTSTAARAKYRIAALPTLGGTQGRSNSVNEIGWVTGWANLTGDLYQHATLWRPGQITDLGTLGGNNSTIEWPVLNTHGIIVGGSETTQLDPNGENFCLISTGTTNYCRGFLWQNGSMVALPTLGGPNSYAVGVNNRDLVIGWSETAAADPSCAAPQVYNIHGFTYQNGALADLPPLPGDQLSGPLALNDSGEIVGTSGICANPNTVGFPLTRHAVMWKPNGSVIDLGNLGGSKPDPNNFQSGFAATNINDLGQVVGFSVVAGDTTVHAFLWDQGVMTDIPPVAGDALSVAWGIGEHGEVLGQSCDVNFNCRGFIWKNGILTDINALLPAHSNLYVIDANFLNEEGEITGQAVDLTTGAMPAVLISPVDNDLEEAGDGLHRDLPQHVRDAIKAKARQLAR
jgi:probable HAF family extracellular repeat protein